jgi:8-amino-7-oxononanoate synthase
VKRSTPPGLGFLDTALEVARASDLLRERPHPGARSPGAVGDLLSFCSNDYLGLAHQAAPPEESGAGASRLVDGDRPIHARLEEAAAALVGQPSALVFTSGYAANVGLLSALAGPEDVVVSDALNHASIIDGARLSRARIEVVPHLDLAAMDRTLRNCAARRAFVVTESYFSMDADAPDLAALRAICDRHGAALLVDEAHALGVLGPEGRGLCVAAGVTADAVIGTFGKAFGAGGAFVAGCESLSRWLWNRARSFVFSTGLSPAVAAAALQGMRSAQQEPERRKRTEAAAAQLREGLVQLDVHPLGFGHVVPWVLGDPRRALAMSRYLAERGFDVRAIRPPSVPRGTARLRLTVSASHTPQDIERLVSAVRGALTSAASLRDEPAV